MNWKSLCEFHFFSENSCRTPQNHIGNCIPITHCPSLLSLLTQKPLSSINRRFLQKSGCGFKDRTPQVCCAEQAPIVDLLPSPLNKSCGWSVQHSLIGDERAKIDDFPWLALIFYKDGRSKNYIKRYNFRNFYHYMYLFSIIMKSTQQ
jgi:hypothetical protein